MRVLHVIPAIADRYGGPSVVVIAAARALQRAGHDVLVATTDADGEGRLDVPVGATTSWSGIPVIFFSRVVSEAFKWAPALASWLRGHVKEFDVVDVHAVFSYSSIEAGRACRKAMVPYVVRPHGALDPWSLSRKPLQKQMVLFAGARRMLAHAARMQYTTLAEQRLAENALPWLPAGAVVPLGVDEEWFAETTGASGDPYVLAMSRLDRKKRLELLIDAFHAIASDATLPRWRLVLAGEGRPDYVIALRTRAREGAAADCISFVGWVSGDEKQRLVRGASLFASPSTQENFGLSIVEAMAAGVPVLVSPGVNLAEEIDAAGAGWVVDRDASTLVAPLRMILGDVDERAVRGRAARRLADRYRWDRSTEALVAMYQDVVSIRNVTSHV